MVGCRADGVAHVGLLEDFRVASASATILHELVGREAGAADAVDGVDEAHLNGLQEGDAGIDVPGTFGGTGFLGELVKQSIFAIVR